MPRFERTLIDLSGTLHVDDVITRNAVEALKKLRQTGRRIRFVTNTTKESGRCLFERLQKLGFEAKQEEIFSSLAAARRLVVKEKLRPMYLLSESAMEDFADLNPLTGSSDPMTSPALNSVVVGLAPTLFNYETLTQAMRVLLPDTGEGGIKEETTLIAIHKGRYMQSSNGLVLGPGAFVAGLEYSTGKTATVVGKPTQEFFASAIADLEGAGQSNVHPESLFSSTVMIGDDVFDDVQGPLQLGMGGILVRTGKYRKGDETKSSILPTAVCDDFASAVEWLLETDPV